MHRKDWDRTANLPDRHVVKTFIINVLPNNIYGRSLSARRDRPNEATFKQLKIKHIQRILLGRLKCVEYAAKVYDSGSRRGGDYDIEPVYFIGILGRDRIFERVGSEWESRYISEYTFREKHTGEVPDESISLIFVELDRFVKPLDECVGLTEKWCYALKYVGKLHELPEGLRIQAFERLFAACEIARFSRDKKLQYEKDMITERDYRNILETARENGFAAGRTAGIAEGKAEGLAEGKADVARTMLTMGLSDEVILQATGLSVAELASLKEN